MKRIKIHPKDNPAFLLARNIAPRGQEGPTKAKTPEQTTQTLTERYLDSLGLWWFHMPPYVLRAAFAQRRASGAELGALAHAAAIVRGLPDLLIWDGRGRCLPIELKTEARASKLTAAQRLWQRAIGTKEARSFEEAKALIDSWRVSAGEGQSPEPSQGNTQGT